MTAPDTTSRGPAERRGWPWLERLGALGAIVFAVWLAISFFTSPDTGDTAAEVLASAKDDDTANTVAQLLALLAPVLIGLFVASLVARMYALEDLLPRALTLIGGTLFIAFFTVAITIWTAPLIESEEMSTPQAEAYLAFDDVGWVLLGAAGVAAGVMIIGASLAALRLRWVPTWLGWLSIALGVVAFFTVALIGLFAWVIWFLVAGALLLWRGGSGAPRRAYG